MVLRSFFALILSVGILQKVYGDMVAVTEESLPKLPEQIEGLPREQTCPNPIQLKGIVIVGSRENVLAEDELKSFNGIRIQDLEVPYCREFLANTLESFIGKCLTCETLVEIKSAISGFYTRYCYPLVIIEVPDQDITDGVLQLVVHESRLGQACVEGNRWTRSNILMSYVDLQPGELISENRLIQNVSFMNRNPFRRVDIVYEPGQELYTTDVILSVKERSPFRFYTGVDNTGVDLTERGRWYTGFNWGNAFTLDHILSYQFTSAFDVKRFHAHTGEYIALLSWGHVFDVYGGYSTVHPEVEEPIKRNKGWSMQVSGRYVVPLHTTHYLEQEVQFGGDFKRTNNTFEFTDDFPTFGKNVNLTQLVLGYGGNYERNQYRLDFEGNFFISPGRWLSDQSNSDYESLRPGAVNHWIYFKGGFTYLQRLPKGFSLSLMTQGQGSTQPLLPSEQFGIGGYDTVRGYEQRELNKDNGIIASLEARTPAKKILPKTFKLQDTLQFLVFIDYGWGIDNEIVPGTKKSDYLLGVGPGVRFAIDTRVTARLDLGIKLHDEPDFQGGCVMPNFNVTVSF